MPPYDHAETRQIAERTLSLLHELLETLGRLRQTAVRYGPPRRVAWADESLARVEKQIQQVLTELMADAD
jgi:hypothetical protein